MRTSKFLFLDFTVSDFQSMQVLSASRLPAVLYEIVHKPFEENEHRTYISTSTATREPIERGLDIVPFSSLQ